MGTAEQHGLSFLWESDLIGRAGALTWGLNETQGLYARTNWAATAQFPALLEEQEDRGGWERAGEPPVHVGTSAPRHCGGFTVYRPEHWCLAGTALEYGDVFGANTPTFGYEVDGLSYIVEDGVPRATGKDGADPAAIEIIAMGLAFNGWLSHWPHCHWLPPSIHSH